MPEKKNLYIVHSENSYMDGRKEKIENVILRADPQAAVLFLQSGERLEIIPACDK